MAAAGGQPLALLAGAEDIVDPNWLKELDIALFGRRRLQPLRCGRNARASDLYEMCTKISQYLVNS